MLDSIKRKYELPLFLQEIILQKDYEIWLSRKVTTHLKRDRKRGNDISTREHYKLAIHKAVCESNGFDSYTGKPLRWDLICKYNNEESKEGGRIYKSKFCDLPTINHIEDGKGHPDFVICSWKVNDAKNDLNLADFISLCQDILEFHQKRTLILKEPINNLPKS